VLSTKKRPLKWPTIEKLKSGMSQVLTHAQRHQLIPATLDTKGRPTNTCLLARCKSESAYEAKVVEPEQMIAILDELDTPETVMEWTLALAHAAAALRTEEAFGLMWMDTEWTRDQIKVRRAWSKGKLRDDDAYDLWLDPRFQKPDAICDLLKLFDPALMRRYEVSCHVNLVKNHDPDCAERGNLIFAVRCCGWMD
jgi:hypothetical protein